MSPRAPAALVISAEAALDAWVAAIIVISSCFKTSVVVGLDLQPD
jgi:hypothetical protein